MGRFESKKKYSKISYIKRVKLIQLTEEEGLGVTKAARQLRIKIPTAKVILSNYRKKGIIYKKKTDKTVLPPPPEIKEPIVKEEPVEEPILKITQKKQEESYQAPLAFFSFFLPSPIPEWNGMIFF